jgi:hypothetical protein
MQQTPRRCRDLFRVGSAAWWGRAGFVATPIQGQKTALSWSEIGAQRQGTSIVFRMCAEFWTPVAVGSGLVLEGQGRSQHHFHYPPTLLQPPPCFSLQETSSTRPDAAAWLVGAQRMPLRDTSSTLIYLVSGRRHWPGPPLDLLLHGKKWQKWKNLYSVGGTT